MNATVDWGDGSAPQPVTVTGDAVAWSFSGTQHTYAEPGRAYTITVGGLAGGSDTVQFAISLDSPAMQSEAELFGLTVGILASGGTG